MRHTTEITLVNRADEILAESGIIERREVRRLLVRDALVDTGATRLSLPQSLIGRLGLTPVGTTRSFTANGTVERSIYSEVRFTVLGRSGTLEVTNLPDDAPVLVGHMVMELLDLAVDMQRGLIYNPAHDGKWIEEQPNAQPDDFGWCPVQEAQLSEIAVLGDDREIVLPRRTVGLPAHHRG